MISGIVLGDKPPGITSSHFVGDLKRTLKQKKVGHAGTLDRFASGLVILLVGKATAFAAHFLDLEKSYRAVFVFGRSTDTHDPEGQTISQSSPEEVSRFLSEHKDKIWAEIASFEKDTMQTPPLYSALKKAGERFSDRARRGEVDLPKPRAVRVTHASAEAIDPASGWVRAHFCVSSGTYIRAFARDLSERLEFPVMLGELRRLRIGRFALEMPVWARSSNVPLIGIPAALEWPIATMDADATVKVRQGRMLAGHWPQGDFLMIGPGDDLVAWAFGGTGSYLYRRVFPASPF